MDQLNRWSTGGTETSIKQVAPLSIVNRVTYFNAIPLIWRINELSLYYDGHPERIINHRKT